MKYLFVNTSQVKNFLAIFDKHSSAELFQKFFLNQTIKTRRKIKK